jgi:hypothetical protein
MRLTVFCLLLGSCASPVCPHDGRHGDSASVTVRHNGRKATVTVATAYMLEGNAGEVGRAAECAFENTRGERER